MGYVNTTSTQVTRAAGGWVFAFALFGFILTSDAWVTGVQVGVPVVLLVLTLASGALFWRSSVRLRALAHVNAQAMKEPGAMEPLDRRRATERQLVIIRHALFAAFLVLGVTFITLVSTLVCPLDQTVCTGIVPDQERWLHVLQPLTLTVGAMLVAVAFLARTMREETDRLDNLASDATRRREEGPVPGLNRRRWE